MAFRDMDKCNSVLTTMVKALGFDSMTVFWALAALLDAYRESVCHLVSHIICITSYD